MYHDEYTEGAEFSFPRALSVSEISEFVKRVFYGVPQFSSLSVQGEISNFKNHFGTGHFYHHNAVLLMLRSNLLVTRFYR